MAGSSALVTGATGFLGSKLARHLAERGVQVRALVRPSSDRSILQRPGVTLVEGDLFEPASLVAACSGVDVVFHCAGQVAEWSRRATMIASHVVGTHNILHAAQMAGVRRLVHTSSVAALGVPEPDTDDPEAGMTTGHLWNSRAEVWPYGFAKHRSETAVWQAVAAGLDAVMVAPSVVVGPGDFKRIDQGIQALLTGGWVPPVAPAGGLNLVHIDDVVLGLEAAAIHGRPGSKYLLVGQNLSHLDFLRITAEVAGTRPPRWLLPTAPLRALGRLAVTLSPYLPLPPESTMLSLMGYHFYYAGGESRTALGLPPARDYRQAAQETRQWLIEERLQPA